MSIHQHGILKPGLVRDSEATHVRRMRQAVWLFLFLVVAANRQSGRRLISPAVVAREMGLPEATVRSWLGHLRKGGYVTTERQGRLVRVTIARWPRADAPVAMAARHGDLDDRAKRAQQLAEDLGGDPEDPMWDAVVRAHTPEQIEGACKKALDVPANQVRKSRVALFRYFLKTHS